MNSAKVRKSKANTKKRTPKECRLFRGSCHFSDRPRRGSLLRLLVLVEPFAYVLANNGQFVHIFVMKILA